MRFWQKRLPFLHLKVPQTMIKPLTFLLCKQQMLPERREKSVQNHAKHPAALSGSVVRGVEGGRARRGLQGNVDTDIRPSAMSKGRSYVLTLIVVASYILLCKIRWTQPCCTYLFKIVIHTTVGTRRHLEASLE